MDSEERVNAAAGVFVYGYPLVYALSESIGFTTGSP